MSRISGWEDRLRSYVVSVKDTPFVWGQHDCLLFAAGCVQAVTGRDLADNYRGKYSTARQAKQLLKQITAGEGTVDAALDRVGQRLPSVLAARRGDLVATVAGRGPCIGVVGPGGCFFVSERGLFRVPIRMCYAAWRIY